MKRALALLLSALLLLLPAAGLAELTEFTPERTDAAPAAALAADEAGRALLAALLLQDCLDTSPAEEALPDFADCRLLVNASQICVLFSAGGEDSPRVLALFYGLEAHNASWDAVETKLTDALAERLCKSLGFQAFAVDAEAVRASMETPE